MVDIVEKEKFLSSEFKCKHCGDKGKIKIYRVDWEDFEIIDCNYCKPD